MKTLITIALLSAPCVASTSFSREITVTREADTAQCETDCGIGTIELMRTRTVKRSRSLRGVRARAIFSRIREWRPIRNCCK